MIALKLLKAALHVHVCVCVLKAGGREQSLLPCPSSCLSLSNNQNMSHDGDLATKTSAHKHTQPE